MTENKKVISNFFVIEGLDGAGTTTQAKKLATELTDSIFTWEPTNSDFGKMLRQILSQNLPIDKITLAHLFATDRSNHLYNETGILNQCKTHKVFCDRYILSSFAYQSIDVNEEIVLSLNKDFPIPQITFFIDTPVDICMQRIEKRDNREIYEHTELQLKIREKYLKGIEFFKNLGWNIHIIDGTKNIDEIFIDICKYL
jgi:dTMP kinase